MEIGPTTLVLLTTGSALLGIIVTSVFNLLAARSTRKSEERRQNESIDCYGRIGELGNRPQTF